MLSPVSYPDCLSLWKRVLSGYETVVSNNEVMSLSVVSLSVTLYVAQKWNRSRQVSALDFS